MPSYAVLGATGNTGQALLQVLIQSPDTTRIHAYCHDGHKLAKLSPADDRVRVFEGRLQDIELLASCLSGTRAAFLAVAQTVNVPGCRIALDTARVVISALERLRARDEKLPALPSTRRRAMSHFRGSRLCSC